MNTPPDGHHLPPWNYDADSHVAELYDQSETSTDDVELIRSLIGSARHLRILEPFCGTGRILLPLAQDGHAVTGIDASAAMLERAQAKLGRLPADVQARVTLRQGDVLDGGWPGGQDLVVLGANCFYELATEADQESCIKMAAASLVEGGCVYVDNGHRGKPVSEDDLGPSCVWPEGTCEDGTHLRGELVCLGVDASRNYVRYKRILTVTTPDGCSLRSEWAQQKHPVSGEEVREWLVRHGFALERLLGDRQGSEWAPNSGRAIVWARLRPTLPP